jgi:hypothetical protein
MLLNMPEESNKRTTCDLAIPMQHPTDLGASTPPNRGLASWLMPGLAGLLVWGFVYCGLASFAAWFTYSLLQLPRDSHLGAAVEFFLYESPKVLMLVSIMGKGAWWSVPLAVLIGVPMYSNAAGIIPIVQALLGKGAALGTVLAFMMSVIALSLPEAIILRKVLKPRLIATFFGVVALGILIVGYLFNFII